MNQKNRIIARMLGGLGNQLFIYSYAKYIKDVTNDNREILFEISSYNHNKFNQLDIVQLPISKEFKVLDIKSEKQNFLVFTSEIFRRIDCVIRKLTSKTIDDTKIDLRRFGLYYTRVKAPKCKKNPPKTIYMYGYFQNAIIAKRLSNKEKKGFVLSANRMSECAKEYEKIILSNPKNVAISIRCLKGYSTGLFHVYSPNYYFKAIEYLENRLGKFHLFVFADDIDTVTRSFSQKEFSFPITYISGCTACEQLTLMSLCQNYIISNSSFSWWGAHLGTKNNKIIAAPTIWWNNIHIKQFGLYSDNMILFDDSIISGSKSYSWNYNHGE